MTLSRYDVQYRDSRFAIHASSRDRRVFPIHRRAPQAARCSARLTPASACAHHGRMHKLALSLLLVLSACAAQDGTTPATAPATAPAAGSADGVATLARIRSMVGSAACAGDGECRSLPLGAKACGGPDGYLAFSTKATSEPKLRALAQTYADERRKANSASGMVSNCLFMPDPGAVCRAGTCQLGTAVPASAQ